MSFEKLLPVFAPAPAGVVLAISLYNQVLAAIGVKPEAVGYWWILAAPVAVLGFVGMIGIEMQTYKQAAIAIADRRPWTAFVAFLLALLCTGLLIWSVWRDDSSKPLLSIVVVSVVGYATKAIMDGMARSKANEQTAKTDARADRLADVQIERERMAYNVEMEKQKTAQARAAVRSGSFGSNKQANASIGRKEKDPALLMRVREYLEANPSASVRSVCDACGIRSTSTASAYMKAVR